MKKCLAIGFLLLSVGSNNFSTILNSRPEYEITINSQNNICQDYILQGTPKNISYPSYLVSGSGTLVVTIYHPFLMKETNVFNFVIDKSLS